MEVTFPNCQEDFSLKSFQFDAQTDDHLNKALQVSV